MQPHGEFLQALLKKRGITSPAQVNIFLNPDYERDLLDPFLMRDMGKACARLFDAIEAKEKIIIYADYDCDGIPGAVILSHFLKLLGHSNYEVYIPQRNSEGYGLNVEALENFARARAHLLITVDLGITAIEEVARASELGIDVIITDHHLPRESFRSDGMVSITLPLACAVLNPKTDDYPEKMLCGAGVAFKLVQGFISTYADHFGIKDGAEKWMLDMAGIATLSDMVPLLGENRALAYFGMKVLRRSSRVGLQKLLAKLKIEQRYLTEDDIGFMVAPRLNAASRMDDPMRAYELLSSENEVEAERLADHLSKINDERKTIVTGIMREVNKKFESRVKSEVIVIGNPKWRVGILGLVAGKILDQYKKPVFVWGRDENGFIKGSCRSDGSVSVVELMTDARESFLEYGGHELAGGFTVHGDKIHLLEETLCVSFQKVKRGIDSRQEQEKYDLKLTLRDVNSKNWNDIQKLAPFGLENPKPVFLFEGVRIEKIKKFGKNGSGEHLEITFSDATQATIKAVSFFSDHDSFSITLAEGLGVNLLATFDLSRFLGREELRLRVVDILRL